MAAATGAQQAGSTPPVPSSSQCFARAISGTVISATIVGVPAALAVGAYKLSGVNNLSELVNTDIFHRMLAAYGTAMALASIGSAAMAVVMMGPHVTRNIRNAMIYSRSNSRG